MQKQEANKTYNNSHGLRNRENESRKHTAYLSCKNNTAFKSI